MMIQREFWVFLCFTINTILVETAHASPISSAKQYFTTNIGRCPEGKHLSIQSRVIYCTDNGELDSLEPYIRYRQEKDGNKTIIVPLVVGRHGSVKKDCNEPPKALNLHAEKGVWSCVNLLGQKHGKYDITQQSADGKVFFNTAGTYWRDIKDPTLQDKVMYFEDTVGKCPAGSMIQINEQFAYDWFSILNEMSCKNIKGERNGPFLSLWSSGTIRKMGTFINGQRNGLWYSWGYLGDEYEITNYLNDKKHGLNTKWMTRQWLKSDAQKISEENYNKGKKHGIATYYDHGKNVTKVMYLNDRLNCKIVWDYQGNKISETRSGTRCNIK